MLSFIIPAYNEEKNLPGTLESILRFCPADLLGEIVVVDNGSTDATRAVAEQHGARVICSTASTIGGVRNDGAKTACGDVLVFIDADVTLTQSWGNEIPQVVAALREKYKTISGSKCRPPQSNNFIVKYWFSEIAKEQDPTHIGSGHTIVTKQFFNELGGFSEVLKTGEDYDFCVRAVGGGGRLEPNPTMVAVHHGYPATLLGFVMRESWHGTGDVQSVKAVMASKVALMAILFSLIHVQLVMSFFFGSEWLAIGIALLLLHLGASLKVKMPHVRWCSLPGTMMVFYFYYWGRALSFVRRWELIKKIGGSRS